MFLGFAILLQVIRVECILILLLVIVKCEGERESIVTFTSVILEYNL